MENDEDFEKSIENAYKGVYNKIQSFCLKSKEKNLIFVIQIKFDISDALEIHFVTNKQLHGIFLGKIEDSGWQIPPETLPLSSTNYSDKAMVRFLENKDIFNKTVYMIQYRIEKFSNCREKIKRLEFSVIDEKFCTIEEGIHNYKITFA